MQYRHPWKGLPRTYKRPRTVRHLAPADGGKKLYFALRFNLSPHTLIGNLTVNRNCNTGNDSVLLADSVLYPRILRFEIQDDFPDSGTVDLHQVLARGETLKKWGNEDPGHTLTGNSRARGNQLAPPSPPLSPLVVAALRTALMILS